MRDSDSGPTAGPNGPSIAPPSYGIDCLDHGAAIQRKPELRKTEDGEKTRTPDHAGLPDPLKSSAEGLSGLSLDDVRVHYNSSKPAQLNALAYTQGTDIHVAPGQERHLPHEAWHVVQQKQGRVRATTQLKGAQINDDRGLEQEAERMGARSRRSTGPAGIQRMQDGNHPDVVQRVIGRVDDIRPEKRRSAEDFVKVREVERMIEYLQNHYTGDLVDVDSAGKGSIPITEGEHWFAGHGSGTNFGEMNPESFFMRLDFSKLPKAARAILHLISCNLGNMAEPSSSSFAKGLRRLIQADPQNEGKIIVIEAAPAFVIYTEAVRASFPSKKASKAVGELHEALEEAEDDIDQRHAAQLWGEFKPLLEDQGKPPALPSKKGFNEYLGGISYAAVSDELKKFTTSTKLQNPRELFINSLEKYATENPIQFLRSSHLLAKVLDTANKGTTFIDIYKKILSSLELDSQEAWKTFEEKILGIQNLSGVDVLTPDDPQRGALKAKLKEKNKIERARFGWIQYSSKGRYKPPQTY